MSIKDYSLVPGDNATAPGINMAEGMPPGDVNDGVRQVMADIRRSWEQRETAYWGGTSTGAANVYDITPVIALTGSPATYADGAGYDFIAHQANTGPATLSVSGLAAAAIQWQGAALIGGEIPNGAVIKCLYDGTQFQLISPEGFKSGEVLQKVVASTTTSDSNSTTTLQASNVSASITPKLATSTIRITGYYGHQINSTTLDNIRGLALPYRDSTAIGLSLTQTRQIVAQPRSSDSSLNSLETASIVEEDAPNTTSAVTYAIWHAATAAGEVSTIPHGKLILEEIKT